MDTRSTPAGDALRANELRLRFLDTLGRETAKSGDADNILATTTRMLGEHLDVSSCAYADMEPDQDGFTIRGDWAAPGAMHITGRYSLADFGRKAVTELSAGRPLIINDNLRELAPEEAASFQAIGIGATICMPLVIEGRLTALMAIHHRVPHNWSGDELVLLREVTERSWAHIERVRASKAAAEAAEHLALATRASGIGTWDLDPVSGHLRWDDRCKALFGLPPEAEVSYETAFLRGLHPQDRERADEAVARALAADGPGSYHIEYRTIGMTDGIERWISFSGEALFEVGRAVRFIGTVLDITARKKAERPRKFGSGYLSAIRTA
jgi:PAS domain S-box-containing protein